MRLNKKNFLVVIKINLQRTAWPKMGWSMAKLLRVKPRNILKYSMQHPTFGRILIKVAENENKLNLWKSKLTPSQVTKAHTRRRCQETGARRKENSDAHGAQTAPEKGRTRITSRRLDDKDRPESSH